MRGLIDSLFLLKHLPVAKTTILNDENDLLKVDYPVFMKIDSGEHKLKLGGVLRCKNLDEAKENFKFLKKKFSDLRIVLQEEVLGVELIIGLKEDSVFGKIIMIGLGGSFVEEKEEVSFRSLPIHSSEIQEMLDELPIFNSLVNKGYPVKKLISLVEDICILSEKEKIIELDLNPVIINQKGLFIVDARINQGV